MSAKSELCWYCRERRAEVWCDYLLGSAAAPDRCEWDPQLGDLRVEGRGCTNKATLLVGADGQARVCDACAEAPALRRYRKRKRIEPSGVDVVETCDAGACLSCARRCGWRRRGHICGSPRSKSQTIDHCHVHAQADGFGSSAWLGAPAIDVLRGDVRADCVRRMSASTCPNKQTSGGPTS